MRILTTQLQLPLNANKETNWFKLQKKKNRKFNVKFVNSFGCQVAEVLAVTTLSWPIRDLWRQGCPPWH
jgi:hypothetical protein